MCRGKEEGSFVLGLKLRYSDGQRARLDKLMRVGNRAYNALVEEGRRRLDALERDPAWRANQKAISEVLSRGDLDEGERRSALGPLGRTRTAMLRDSGFTRYSFEAILRGLRRPEWRILGTHVEQKIAQEVWAKFERYLWGNGREIRFRPLDGARSLEGKTNGANLRYRDGVLLVGKMPVRVCLPETDWEKEALERRVKYCRLVRILWKDGWLYRLQLVLEGAPPPRSGRDGCGLCRLGAGPVGFDIGPQTLAAVSAGSATLEELAPGANMPWKELRRVNRAMDRSRRANNPDFFDAEGRIVPVDRLPAGRLRADGRRDWRDSANYRRLRRRRRYLCAKCARIRKAQHGALANRLLPRGDTFLVEDMRWRALARRAKPAGEEREGRPARRKRFGRPIANKAPATFLRILQEKVERCGGSFGRIDTVKARASQYDHVSGTYAKPALSQRFKTLELPDGPVRVQRDLYGAFLIMNSNTARDGFDQTLCERNFPAFLTAHDVAVENLRRIHTPSSTGIAWRQVAEGQHPRERRPPRPPMERMRFLRRTRSPGSPCPQRVKGREPPGFIHGESSAGSPHRAAG